MKDLEEFYKQIGSLIRARRKEEGLSQEDLGDRIDLTRTSVNNIESGRQRIQIHTLYDAAEALKVQPVELLPPAHRPGTIQRATTKMLQGVPREIREWVKEMSTISPQLNLGQLAIDQLRASIAKRKGAGNALDFSVSELLSGLRTSEPPVPVETLARDLGVTLRHGPCQAGVASFILEQDQRIIIAVNSAEPTTRQRFAIAHSLGHLLLQKKVEGYRLDPDFNVSSDPEEQRANEFAVRLLVPEDWLRVDLDRNKLDFENAEKVSSSLARRYKVSRQVLTARMLTLAQTQF